jgi:hypothetical protein
MPRSAVARAKQTDRAEARRRHRLASRPVDVEGDEDVEDEPDDEPATNRSGSSDARGARQPSSPARRPSIFGSFRAAYRRPDYRADLAALPKLLLTVPFVASLAMIVVGEAVWTLYPGYSVAAILWQYLTVPPAIAPIFAVGFFSKRASYILGFLVGLADAIVFVSIDRPVLGTTETLYLIVSSAVLGAVLAAGLAWYRRFLAITQPRRTPIGKPSASKGRPQAKPARRR